MDQARGEVASDVHIDFKLGTSLCTDRPALMILVDGLPETLPVVHVVAAIVGSLQTALGVEIVESVIRRSH